MSQSETNRAAKIVALGALATLFSLPAFAAAAAPPPDKSQYTLFNPVPDDLMRSFSTDRPTKSNSPYTVDAGHFQYEADIVNWTYDRYNASHATASNFLVGDPTLKVGLTQNTDLEMALAPLNFNQSHNLTTGARNTASGFGDVFTRVKFNLLGNEGGDYAFALVPYVKAPTAAHNVGNNHWEGGGYAPFQVALPDDWSLTLMSELDILENAALNGHHANYQNLVNVGHPVFSDTVTGYVEFWSDVNNDQNVQPQYTLDFAAAWLVKDNLQLDVGVNFGLNKAASDVQPYLGISQRF
jgi:hypothetical protein